MTNDQEALCALYRQELHPFSQKSFETLNPGETFDDNWHLRLLTWILMQCANRQIRRLIVCLPPRSLKSMLCSIAFPAWVMGNDPTARFICASYNDDLARKHTREFRRLIESPWYKKAFPAMRPYLTKNTEHEIVTRDNGFRFATSIGGTLTGRGGNFMLIDDPIKASESLSEAERTRANEWLIGTAYSRFDNPNEDVMAIITQRTHVDDMVGYALERDAWHVINIPAIAKETEKIQIGDNEFHIRKIGEALQPSRMSLERLEQMKKAIGSYNFSAQYQQDPVPPEGNLIKAEWFKQYDCRPDPHGFEIIVQSWDTASETGEGHSYSVCLTFGVKENRYHLLNVLRERMDFPTLQTRVVRHAKNWGADHILIENASSGRALLQMLRHETPLPLIPIPVDTDKVTRVARVSSYIEAGRVFLPKDDPWLAAFMREILAFPHVRFDDQVDALAQFLYWAQDRDHRPKPRVYILGGRSGDRYYDRTGIHTF